MNDFRGPLPLTDADFTRIRANVMAQVRPRARSFAFRWAFAMLAAAFIGVVSYKSLQVTPVVTPAPPPPPLRHAERSEACLPPQLPAAVPAPPRAHSRSPFPVPRSSPIEAPTFRMEIQTADPDIRIIWLPNQYDPKSEESSS